MGAIAGFFEFLGFDFVCLWLELRLYRVPKGVLGNQIDLSSSGA